MSDYLSQSPETVYVRPARSIGGLTFDVTIEEQHSDEAEITEHPVEQGAAITDHAFVKPATLTIRGGQSDSGGTSTGDRRSVEAYEALLKLYRDREPFTVVTGKRTYENMLVKSISATTDQDTEHALAFTCELREILLARVQTVAVPRSRQRHANRTGGVDQKGQVQAQEATVPPSAIQSGFGTSPGYRRTM